jgi:protein involved in sex pheromone biosynthesis
LSSKLFDDNFYKLAEVSTKKLQTLAIGMALNGVQFITIMKAENVPVDAGVLFFD